MTAGEHGLLGLLTLAVVAGALLAVRASRTALQRLARVSALLAFVLVVFGAYVRLADAGLGCPDWPGCYGNLTPSDAHLQIRSAEVLAPQGPVTLAKAWKEMLHRYLAMLLGCLIIAMAIASVRLRARMHTQPVLACGLLAVVLLQGAFGALTVTLRLMPLIVTMHLLGGLLTLLLLTIYASRVGIAAPADVAAGLPPDVRSVARRVLALLFVQVALGGWVSTNYAAPVCGALPSCQGKWWPATDFEHGFEFMRELGRTAAGDGLPLQALVAIHLAHRLFALVVFVAVALLARRLWRAGHTTLGAALVAAVGVQVAIGVKVVWAMSSPHLQLPLQLPTAVAHNAGAATLVVLLAVISFAGFLELTGAPAGLRAAARRDSCKPQPVPPSPPMAPTQY